MGTGKGGCPRGTDAGLSATWANLGYAHLCCTLQHCDFALALIFMLQLTAQSAPAAWLTRFIRALKDWLISLSSLGMLMHMRRLMWWSLMSLDCCYWTMFGHCHWSYSESCCHDLYCCLMKCLTEVTNTIRKSFQKPCSKCANLHE